MMSSDPVKLVVLDPGHFHAALLQKEMHPSVSPRASVYAPLGRDLLDYLNRIASFNARAADPTHWELDVHCCPEATARMLEDRPGGVMILAGRNRAKIDRILAAVGAGMHVLADKPWIISSADIPKLEQALEQAEKTGVVAFDMMTERFEITSILQRILVNEPAIFGELRAGTSEAPGIRARSVHHVMKLVAGAPLQRPVWFFDVADYGEALADVGTHVVDLAQWTAFPDQAIDYREDIQLLEARRWPLVVTAEQFQQVTGTKPFPRSLEGYVRDGNLEYWCNNSVRYTLRGIHVELEIIWNWEAPPGAGDVYEAAFQGSKARVEIRQGEAEKHVPELYVTPVDAAPAEVLVRLREKIQLLQTQWPGLGVEELGPDLRVVIPQEFRVGHEAHFAQVTRQFFEYLKAPDSLPSWERPNMVAKYYVSAKGVELSNEVYE